MKKLPTIIVSIILIVITLGTYYLSKHPINGKPGVYHTYYGDIDIDTIDKKVIDEEDSTYWYRITVVNSDTIYYNPTQNQYMAVWQTYTGHGNAAAYYDPETKQIGGIPY